MSRNGAAPSFPTSAQHLDTFELYLRDVDALPGPLDREEEVRVARRARAGDADARERLVTANLRLVISYVKRYKGRGVSFADLVALGNEGLVAAVDRFDPDSGNKFISYAVWWIRQRVLQALADQTGAVRVPRSAPDAQTPALLEAYERACRPPASLDAPLLDDGGETLGSLLPGPNGMEENLEAQLDRERLDRLMEAHLTVRERLVVVAPLWARRRPAAARADRATPRRAHLRPRAPGAGRRTGEASGRAEGSAGSLRGAT